MRPLVMYSLLACLLIGGFVCGHTLSKVPSAYAGADSKEAVGVRYADACLRLARLELTRAIELNERVPHARSATRIDWLEANVAAAEEQVRIAREFQYGSTMPLHAAYAEATARSADAEFQSAKELSLSKPGVISPLRLEKLRLQAEITGLRAEMWRDHSNLPSLVDQMQWQIDRLTEDVIELDQRLRTVE